MIKFNKAYNLNFIAALIVNIFFFFTITAYSYPSEHSLRVSVGQKSTSVRMIKKMQALETERAIELVREWNTSGMVDVTGEDGQVKKMDIEDVIEEIMSGTMLVHMMTEARGNRSHTYPKVFLAPSGDRIGQIPLTGHAATLRKLILLVDDTIQNETSFALLRDIPKEKYIEIDRLARKAGLDGVELSMTLSDLNIKVDDVFIPLFAEALANHIGYSRSLELADELKSILKINRIAERQNILKKSLSKVIGDGNVRLLASIARQKMLTTFIQTLEQRAQALALNEEVNRFAQQSLPLREWLIFFTTVYGYKDTLTAWLKGSLDTEMDLNTAWTTFVKAMGDIPDNLEESGGRPLWNADHANYTVVDKKMVPKITPSKEGFVKRLKESAATSESSIKKRSQFYIAALAFAKNWQLPTLSELMDILLSPVNIEILSNI